MYGRVIANTLLQVEITPEEAMVLILKLGGEEDFLGRHIKDSGLLPENYEEVAFDMQERLRKLHRKLP